jgi:NAD(P)-dependent dehydrogenase (short-subunit alcohol dehydrogenase family)
MINKETALIVGVGTGLGAALARACAAEGMAVAAAARDIDKLAPLAQETGAKLYACDATERHQVTGLFEALAKDYARLDLVIYNAAYRVRGPLPDLDPEQVERAWRGAHGAFMVAQAAATRMLVHGKGTIIFTGASASVKGFARSAPFAMAKFGVRGLAQSIARELQPQNIHVAHFVIDGAIGKPGRTSDDDRPDAMLDPAAIAQAYMAVHRQPRSAWSSEMELRPWSEKF